LHHPAAACPFDASQDHAMTDDELAALRWLLGDDNDRRLGIEPGRAALIRLLQNPPLSNADIGRALARAPSRRKSTPIAPGETPSRQSWRFTLVLSRRNGRGRPFKTGTVQGAIEDLKTASGQLAASPDTTARRKRRVRKAFEQEN
jgi:hypothetical protein